MEGKLPLVERRTRSYRTRTITVGVSCLAIALLANLCMSLLCRAINGRLTSQVEIGSIRTELSHMKAGLDAANKKTSRHAFESLNEEVQGEASRLDASGQGLGMAGFWKAYKNFVHFSRLQIDAAAGGKAERAANIAAASTNPAYEKLDHEVLALGQNCRQQAEMWSVISETLTTIILLGAAVTVTVLFSRIQTKLVEVYSLENHQQLAEASERRFRSLIQNNADVIAVVNASGRIKLVSGASERQWGIPPQQLTGDSIFKYTHSDDAFALTHALSAVTQMDEGYAELEARIKNGANEFRHYHAQLSNLTNDPDVQGILLTFHDLTERKQLEQELTHHAFHDTLTGLPNRSLFLDRLSHRLMSPRQDSALCAVLFIDLDNFKVVNDSLGHTAGDRLLTSVAERFVNVLNPGDTVARLGGDEFTILLNAIRSVNQATAAAERVLAALESAVIVDGREVFVTASIGIAIGTESHGDVTGVYVGDGEHAGMESALGMLRDADTAMYEAKNLGKCSYVVFSRRMNTVALERLELGSDLRNAVDGRQLSMLYQPIVDIKTGELKEVEALLRWEHPTRGMISPATFIPLAEETGLICNIGHWVLWEACAQLRRWQTEFGHHADFTVGINVSGRQFSQPDFVDEVSRVLRQLSLEPSRVKLEITETAMLRDLNGIRSVFERLRSLGVRIAIDDFGTGYSSISYLSRLPVDTLKIDQSFVQLLGRDVRNDGVVRAMIAMSQTLGISVTIEGIETLAQLKILQDLECDYGQGYLFSKPARASEISAMLASPVSASLIAVAA